MALSSRRQFGGNDIPAMLKGFIDKVMKEGPG